ncbi:MAG TPA: hypothetical protein VFH51_12290 [Myxococcota bacterium]|nr:hypothetical protein [Myxococcota bacterium]
MATLHGRIAHGDEVTPEEKNHRGPGLREGAAAVSSFYRASESSGTAEAALPWNGDALRCVEPVNQ